MNVVLYSTGCPKCHVLEAKLEQKGIQYRVESDMKVMEEKEFMAVPMLEVDDKIMNFSAAVEWLKQYKG